MRVAGSVAVRRKPTGQWIRRLGPTTGRPVGPRGPADESSSAASRDDHVEERAA